MKKMFSVLVTIVLALVVLFTSTFPVMAQGPVCEGGVCPDGAAGPDDGRLQAEGIGGSFAYSLRGGFVTAGTGLRNRGFGTITLVGIPAGATVYKAFLYWNIGDLIYKTRHQQLIFAGVPINGALIGKDYEPCWLPGYASSYSYRADVTALVKGNGKFAVSGVASGVTTGVDPWTAASVPPLAQGASLVVIYSKSTYPVAQIKIWDGNATVVTTDRSFLVGPFTPLSNPVGPTYAGFVVADGQNNSIGPYVLINGTQIPGSGFEGTAPMAGPNFSNGNLWDTKRFSIGNYITPGATTVSVGLDATNDCVVWEALVISTSSGLLDTDGDALRDGWEANGYDFNNDQVIDVDLPAMGSNPYHKDIFVEHDYMVGDHSHMPSMFALDRVTAGFAAANVSNPDGRSGITMHNDRGQSRIYTGGNAVGEATNMGATCSSTDIWNGFDVYKSVNFNPARLDIFHYVIWAHDQCQGNSSSGLARGIPSSDFLVTLGSWPGFGDENARTGTYMHELGHNLGLTHGGNVGDHVNYKPNHLSVMSYFFQVVGVWRDGARRWDFTRTTINALNEASLNETIGVTGAISLANYGTSYWCGNTRRDDATAASVDWNCNNALTNPVSANINGDNFINVLGPVHHQWANVIFNGGSIGAGLRAVSIPILDAESFITVSPELKFEDTLK